MLSAEYSRKAAWSLPVYRLRVDHGQPFRNRVMEELPTIRPETDIGQLRGGASPLRPADYSRVRWYRLVPE